MATLASSLVSSTSRALPIRVRPDLEAKRNRYQGRVYWVVKDPVALQYFRFEEEEFAILQMLDGESSLEEIADRFEAEFPPQTIRTEELQQFIGMLHRSGLVLTDAGGQGLQLKTRHDERKNKERMAMVANILSVRFKGFDPERLLNFLYGLPPVRWFFSTPALVLCLMLVAAAGTLILVQLDTFQSRLPDFHTFFSVQNWLLLACVLGTTKVLHEFGHGLSCKHFGGECHEMGVMFLVLTPCLYCNVSDSWMLPNRWHRAAIGAAGMYVEVVLASVCTFIWWFSDPTTLLNNICLNVMFVSSVSTIMFNANPLLRYDGYYILSDLLEIPNLRQKASSILSRKLGQLCLGLEPQDDPFLPKKHQGLFALYTVASAVYRWVVVLSILYFLNQVFEPYGLKPIGQLIALSAAWGLVGQPLVKLWKFLKVPGRLNKVKRWRMVVSALVIAAAIAGVLLAPIPSAVFCPVEVALDDAETVYVSSPGVLQALLVKPGDRVAAGQPLARLRNIDLELEIGKLEAQVDAAVTQIEGLEAMSFGDPRAASRINQVNEQLAAAREQLAGQLEDAARLVLKAPIAGTVIPPTIKDARGQDPRGLGSWIGTPFDAENAGAVLQQGAAFCQVGDPTKLEARIAINQSDNELVLIGQSVEIMLDQSTDVVYRSKITRKASEAMEQTPPRLSSLSGGKLATQADESGVPRPLEPHFFAEAPLRGDLGPAGMLRVGLVGQAKIHTAPRTLWERLTRYFWQTFNFD
ncbi:Putative peptide zinc metalloprotease protein YydH [Pirellulimonas nuda]|uniref:Peptide zinc metalloprotease protein YydH n=1 Tax=Pirellulimonas nuda TaxID=2528009 RepID=A0A518D6T8_9BACT|nr:biotin/lipoyl-binding protein [Pirellulimonas nuda]QDU87159.1 Putative peptide zinc metalloprotease protein YydH [Pirellulimonas nuda]